MGACHCGLMVFATLYAWGRLPFQMTISAGEWLQYYEAHFLTMFLGSVMLILKQSMRVEVDVSQALIDLMIGAFIFKVLFWAIRLVLRSKVPPWLVGHPMVLTAIPWICLTPGAFLIWYGWVLRRGRQVWQRFEIF
jgi:hypothetical protein